MPISPELVLEVARFAADEVNFDQLPPEVVAVSKEIIVNAAGVGLAGAAQHEGQTVTKFAQDMGGNGKCTIIGKGLRTSPVYAALANGLMIHLLDFDDEVIPTGSHPGSTVFPVVMALGEMNGIGGRDVLSAFVTGCEVASKLNGALRSTGASPEFAGTIGAAAAAGRLLKLDQAQMTQALLLAAQREAGSRPGLEAGPAKAYRQGMAAMSGLMAAVLVSQGLAAVPNFDAFTSHGVYSVSPSVAKIDAADFADRLGNPYDVVSPGISLKLYPCASASHTVVDATLQLIQQYRVSPQEVSSIKVGVTQSALDALPFPTPANGWEARGCVSFIAASALIYGQPLIDNFTDAAVADPKVRGLMDLVTVEATEEPYRSIPYPASVAITLKDGRTLQHRVEFARGQPELPLSPEEIDAKFLYCSRYILPPDHIEESVIRLRDLENIGNTTGIFSVLGG